MQALFDAVRIADAQRRWVEPEAGLSRMAQTVTLVRHGQTESSARLAYSGRLDIPLTATGRDQAANAARRLSDAGVDAIVTSPLIRAQDTAAAIADCDGCAADASTSG